MKAKANLFRTLVVLWVVLVAVAVALFGVGLRTAEPQTTTPKMQVQDLGTLGGSSSIARGINSSGQVVGYSYTSAGEQHAFLYDASATPKMQDLGTLGGSSSYATGINDSGKVVGYSNTSAGEQHAFLYDRTNGMKDLNDLIPANSGETIYEATAINSDGKIAATGFKPFDMDPNFCGQESYSWGMYFAAVLTPATTGTPTTYGVQDLGTLGADYSEAAGINGSGQVVGISYTSSCSYHAFLYDEGATPKMQDLGALGADYSHATSINDSGQVVGTSFRSSFAGSCSTDCFRAFLYDGSAATPEMQDLGTLGGDSRAWGINGSGTVVGSSYVSGSGDHGFLKESGQPMIDLNTLLPADSGWTIREARAINNYGQIAANGYKDGGGTHALLLTPTIDTTAPTAMAPKHSFTTLSTLGTTTVPVKLTWSATDNPGGSGIASYQLQQSVNGEAYTNVALPSATATTISTSLAPGSTYRYRAAATDKAGNVSAWASGPSFKVTAFQESSSTIVDTGSWTTSALSGAYGGSVQSASALGRNATFTVPAGSKNVEWVSYRGNNRGKAQVWLDGVQQDANSTLTGIQPYDLYSSTAQARKVVLSKVVSTTTSHTLEVRVLGQKNASSTSTRVDIDAFVTTS